MNLKRGGIWVALTLCAGAAQLVWTAWQAVQLSMTCDEGTTYLLFVTHPFREIITYSPHPTANNHLLNSLLSRLSYLAGGPAPWVLRLPNLLAHGLYMYFAWRLSRRFAGERGVLFAALFVVFSLHLYLLDFFSLNRGYGLMAACLLAAVFYLLRHAEHLKPSDAAAGFFGLALATLANFTALNAYVAGGGALLFGLLLQRPALRLRGLLRQLWAPGLITLALARIMAGPLRLLRENEQLYYGGERGFWQDSVMSLIDSLLYGAKGWAFAGLWQFAALAVPAAGLLLATWEWRRAGRAGFFVLLSLWLLLAALSPLAQFYLLGTKLPLARTGLFLLPLWLALLAALLAALADWRPRIGRGAAGALALLLLIHALSCAQPGRVRDWYFDAYTHNMLDELAADAAARHPGRKIRMGIHSASRPGIEFYMESQPERYGWIQEAAPYSDGGAFDYYYINDWERGNIDSAAVLVRAYPVGMLLLRAPD